MGMRAVRLQASCLAEAEELVSRVWLVLVEKNIATPEIVVTDGEGVTTIQLLFASLTQANLIAAAIPSVTTARESAT
jgi:hypothetical protein